VEKKRLLCSRGKEILATVTKGGNGTRKREHFQIKPEKRGVSSVTVYTVGEKKMLGFIGGKETQKRG